MDAGDSEHDDYDQLIAELHHLLLAGQNFQENQLRNEFVFERFLHKVFPWRLNNIMIDSNFKNCT